MKKNHNLSTYTLSVLVILLFGAFGFGWYKYQLLNREFASTKSELEKLLAEATTTNENLTYLLSQEKNKNNEFETQIGEIASTVGTLKKLSETDKELLQKYSKIYFLNENYIPSNLSTIDKSLVYQDDKKEEFHSRALPFLLKLMSAAKEADKPLEIISAYRSFGTQASIKGSYITTYGSGANRFSAEQGFSEHQLGTALDFTTPTLKAGFTSFSDAEAYQWLLNNAYKYGFILSYPKGNSYYIFEPWHWRFVGVSLATKLHEEKINFYDLDQREIDKYLVNIFD